MSKISVAILGFGGRGISMAKAVNKFSDDIVTQLELFHCQTARFLTEIMVMVGEFLPSYIHARLEY